MGGGAPLGTVMPASDPNTVTDKLVGRHVSRRAAVLP